jgi:hypothetical protein
MVHCCMHHVIQYHVAQRLRGAAVCVMPIPSGIALQAACLQHPAYVSDSRCAMLNPCYAMYPSMPPRR